MKVQHTIYIDHEVWDYVKNDAAYMGQSISAYIENRLRPKKAEPTPEPLLKPVKLDVKQWQPGMTEADLEAASQSQ